MNVKLKALGVVVTMLALGALTAANAAATTGGHFTSEVAHTTLSGSASGTHTTKFESDSPYVVQCSSASYGGTASATTVTELTLTPSYSGCKTQTSEGEVASPIHVNECTFVLKIGKKASVDNTSQVACPAGKNLEITHPHCTMKIPGQSFQQGVAYTATTASGKSALTVDWTANMTIHYEGGLCIFIGTTHTASLAGSFVLTGKDTAESAVGIEATGSEDGRFRFESTHTGLTGTQTTASKTTFGVLLGTVECSTATLDGTAAVTAATQITVIPAYAGCTGTGRVVTTHTNGCAYRLTVTGAGTDGQVDIECPTGKSIETTIDKFPEGCTITIPAQTPSGVVDYEEEGAGTGRDLLLTWTLEGIKYVRDGCEVGGEGNNGTMSGSITLSGEDTSGNPKGIWIE